MPLSPYEILGPDQRIAARLPQYELRPQQLEMADRVANAIEMSHHLGVEAGTGVGKSFGYLVPAILAATANQGSDEASPDKNYQPLKWSTLTHKMDVTTAQASLSPCLASLC